MLNMKLGWYEGLQFKLGYKKPKSDVYLQLTQLQNDHYI